MRISRRNNRPRLPIPLVVGLGLAMLASLLGGATVSWGESPRAPEPCFVPPHPQKQGGLPKIAQPVTGTMVSLPVGGADGYRDDHLREGVLGGAALPPPETLRALAILVDFDDQAMTIGLESNPNDPNQSYFDRVLMFLDQMYGDMSGGQVDIVWDITDKVYLMPETMAYYGLDDSIATREADLCRDAVRAADPDFDFSQYNRFMLFHAGPGQEADINDDSRAQIWSVFFRTIDFQYWLTDTDCVPGEFSPDCLGIRTDDIDPATGEPFWVPHMVVLPESESQDGFEFGMLGVVAHEFGHSFGIPDLYDTTAEEGFIFADSQGIGAFGLMGAGIWNELGFYPSEMCAWSKFYVGWLRPKVIRADETASEFAESLTAIQHARNSAAIRIPMGGDEYFLIENRIHDYNGNGKFDFDDANDDGVFDFWDDSYEGAEYDWWMPQELNTSAAPGEDGSGLFIWHIDESIIRDLILFNLVNAEALHKGVDLEEADGIQDLDKLEFTFEAFGDSRDSFWAPHATSFTPHSEPSTDGYNDAHTGVWITDISGPGATMTFRVRFQDPAAADDGDLKAGWPRDLPALTRDFQPVTGDLDGDGTQEIILGLVDTTGYGGIVVLNRDGTSYFDPASGPEFSSWGLLRSDPIVVNIDGNADPDPEFVWVSAETLYVRKGDGSYVGETGLNSSTPVPYFLLDQDSGRLHLSAGHVEPPGQSPVCGLGPAGDNLPEILVGGRSAFQADYTEVFAVAYPLTPGVGVTHPRVSISLPGDGRGFHTLANIDQFDGGLRELVSSIRTESGGYLAVTLFDTHDQDFCNFVDVRCVALTLGDSVAFTPPVVGDLNRDGIEEIVVGDSDGYLHAYTVRVRTGGGGFKVLEGAGWEPSARNWSAAPSGAIFDNSKFEELSGWPVYVGVLEDDEVSIADVDGDGLLEVLAMGAGNELHIINYNGTPIISLPVGVPAEDRFDTPYLSPMIVDLFGDDSPEIMLPLPDGQVRGHDLLGNPLEWGFMGGGNQGTYPVIADLEGDGTLEMISVEDITVEIPEDGVIQTGDESGNLIRKGRVLVREVGEGSGDGPWPAYRQNSSRIARAATPSQEVVEQAALMTEVFVVPNPIVARESADIHFKINSSVQNVVIEIYTSAGRKVKTLNDVIYASTDNLVPWDLTNENGSKVGPGLYLAKLQAEAGSSVEVQTTTFVIVR